MKRAVQHIERRFVALEQLPNQVFRDEMNLQFAFADSSLLTAPEGWGVLTSCARYFGDSEIFAVAVDDVAAHDNFRASRTLTIDPDATRELFLHWLDDEGDTSGTPLYIDARTIAFTGSSAAWGLWIEQDRELAVLGVEETAMRTVADVELANSLWTPSTRVAELLEASYYPDPVPDAFLKRIWQEYRSLTTPGTA